MNDRARNWFLTCNNYSNDELAVATAYASSYKLLAEEVGEECGTPHFHLYVEHKDAKTFSSMKKKFPRANIQIAVGSAEQNKTYLAKQKLILEEGTPKKQGKRSDIETVKDLIAEGANMRSVIPVSKSVQSVRMAEIYFKYLEKARNWHTKILWYWGPTGTGKSISAREMWEEEDVYETMENNKWWEGYDGHTHVIVDDIRESDFSFKSLLRMCDRYGYKVECKGGSRQLLAKEICFTSPKSPQQMFQFCGEDVKQLLRRITEIKEFREDGTTDSVFPDKWGNIISAEYIENASSDEEEF